MILSGRVKLCDHQAGVERELLTWGAREFVAGLALLTGERLFTTAVVVEPGELLVVPVDKLQRLISRDQVLGDLIVRTLLARRGWQLNARTGLRIVGSRSQPDTRRLLEFAERNRLPHVWLDLDVDPAADLVLRRHDTPRDQTPVVVMRGGEMLRRPSNAELATAAGIGTGPKPGQTYDVAIIGAGPAGLAAGVYGASEGLSTVMIDDMAVGGQIGTTSKIENYLGFPVGISGTEFAQRALLQVLRFGASIVLPASVVGLSRQGGRHVIHLDTGDHIATLSVIIATGASYRQIEADGIDRFTANDVFYTPAAVYDRVRPGQPAVIVGGGNSAGQAAVALADNGSPVTVVIRGADLSADMSQYLIDRVLGEPDITIRYRSEVTKLDGSDRLERVTLKDCTTSALDTVPATALFVMIGAQPCMQSFNTAVQWIGTHAAGDRAFRTLMDVYEEVAAQVGKLPPWTLVVEHGLLSAPQQRARAVRGGFGITVQHPLLWNMASQMCLTWGPERTEQVNPLDEWLEAGADLAAGTDLVRPFNPMTGIWGMVTRGTKAAGVQGPEHAIDVTTALRLYTMGTAALNSETDRLGSIVRGKLADLVAYPADPITADVDELPDLKPVFTIVDGAPVHDPDRRLVR